MQVILDDENERAETFTLVSLREGASEHVPLNLALRPPVSFKLVSGSGPVTLLGIQQDYGDSDASDSEDESGLNDSSLVSEALATSSVPSRKRKQDSLGTANKKTKSAEGNNIGDDEDDTIS
ncbi:hypothetical protein, partial [Salmonella sp. s54836]